MVLDFIKRVFGEFDSNGLRYSIGHLKRVHYKIPFWPLAKQSLYAEKTCTELISDYKFLSFCIGEYGHVNSPDELGRHLRLTGMNQWSATAIGDLAYISLHCKDKQISQRAMWLLRWYREYLEKLADK